MTQQKKRHHYIPTTYLKHFTDTHGKIFVYRKDSLGLPLHMKPENTAYEKFYYAQPKPDGSQDNNALEDFFSTEIENHWNPIVAKINSQTSLCYEHENIFRFISTLRVRVPAMRDAVEAYLSSMVREEVSIMDDAGLLPPKPDGCEGILQNVLVSIDPHMSLHAMSDLLSGFAWLYDQMGFRIIRNCTDIPIITSDNPVIIFDPDVTEDSIQPYKVDPPNSRVEMIVPVNSGHIIHGHTDFKFSFSQQGYSYEDCRVPTKIRRINRLVSKFGYHEIYSGDRSNEPVIQKYSEHSPVLRSSKYRVEAQQGQALFFDWVFGTRSKKPKWGRQS